MTILISIIEICYIYYMFHIFETKFTINHPLEKFSLNYLNETVSERLYSYFKHPTTNSSFPESKICTFGKKIIYLLLFYLFFRNFLTFNVINKFNIQVVFITLILSMSNLNAFLYLIPYFITETMIYLI